jgi:enoyl-CoA hydratase/carnithine racemase
MTSGVRTRMESAVAEIRLSDVDGRNSLTPAAISDLTDAFARAEGDPACRVIVLAADGAAFCSGLAIETALQSAEADRVPVLRAFAALLVRIVRSSRPVLARVEGDASGGGVGFMAACDLVLASPKVRLMLPELVVGLIPAIVAPFLLRRMPIGRLRALALGTRALNATEAHTIGLIDEVADDLDGAVDRQIQRLLRCSPAAIDATKRYLSAVVEPDLETRVEDAIRELEGWLGRGDTAEGLRQFASGFAPGWFTTYRRSHA